jgi:membrane protein implicated in regulation of membrane protease activity
MGRESLPGKPGIVMADLTPHGQVQVAGELWSAELVGEEKTLPQGSRVIVVEVNGLQLKVRRTD